MVLNTQVVVENDDGRSISKHSAVIIFISPIKILRQGSLLKYFLVTFNNACS
jgi:hypothetical protein